MAKKKDPLEGMVLVPKPDKFVEFKSTLLEIQTIAQGTLGWQGHAEMLYSLDFETIFDYKFKKKTKKARINEVKSYIQQAYLDKLHDYSELVTEEEAEVRMKHLSILYTDDVK